MYYTPPNDTICPSTTYVPPSFNIVNENTSADNGVIHEINCVMFVQQSQKDDRLTRSQKDKFPITSCCMQTDDEIDSWLSSVN